MELEVQTGPGTTGEWDKGGGLHMAMLRLTRHQHKEM